MTREALLHSPDEGQRQPGFVHARLHSAAAALSDADLLSRVVLLARAEREATVELVAHLAELDARRLYLGQGYGSLFSYCTGALRLAEHAAYNRIEVARACREFPAILDLLVDGSLNLATARLLAPHLRPENFSAVVARAGGKSKREVEVLVARLAPRPHVPSSVRRLPAPVPPVARTVAISSDQEQSATTPPRPDACAPALPPGVLGAGTPGIGTPGTPGVRAAETLGTPHSAREAFVGRPADRPVVAPLAPARYRVQFTVSEETHEKLRRVQDLLRREIPDGDPGAIFDRALTLLLEDIRRKKLAETTRPRPAAAPVMKSRDVPASVKRAVWTRDAGRCAFVAINGRRCTERAFLELHHREPHALGGGATVENIALRCKAHHAYETDLVFGPRIVPPESRAERANSPRDESEGPRRADANPTACSTGLRLPPPKRSLPSSSSQSAGSPLPGGT